MSTRSQLQKKIDVVGREIVELETTMRERRAFMQGLEEAMRMLPKDTPDEKKPEQILRPGSDMAKIHTLLKANGAPLYIADILKGIDKEITSENRSSIAGSLGNYARKRQIFTKTAPNTFGLIEFEQPPQKEPKEEENEQAA